MELDILSGLLSEAARISMSMVVDTASGVILQKDSDIMYPEECRFGRNTGNSTGKSETIDAVEQGIDCQCLQEKKNKIRSCGRAVPQSSHLCELVMYRDKMDHRTSFGRSRCSFRAEYGDGIQSGHIRDVQRISIKGVHREMDLDAFNILIGLSTESLSCSFRHNIAGMDFSKTSLLTQLYDKGVIDEYKIGLYASSNPSSLSSLSAKKPSCTGPCMILGSFDPLFMDIQAINTSHSSGMIFPIYRGREMVLSIGSKQDVEYVASVQNMNRNTLDHHIYTIIDRIVIGNAHYGRVSGTIQTNESSVQRFSAIVDTSSTALSIPKYMYTTYIDVLTIWARRHDLQVVDKGELCLVHRINVLAAIKAAKATDTFPLISLTLQGNSKSVDILLLETSEVRLETNEVCLKLESSNPKFEQIVLGTPFFLDRYTSLDLTMRQGTISDKIVSKSISLASF